jgi:hypothetical protein
VCVCVCSKYMWFDFLLCIFTTLHFVICPKKCLLICRQAARFSLRRRSGRLLYVGKNNEIFITLSDKKGICHMLTERLQVKAAVDGTCTDINKQMLGHSPQGGWNVGRVEMRWSERHWFWIRLEFTNLQEFYCWMCSRTGSFSSRNSELLWH